MIRIFCGLLLISTGLLSAQEKALRGDLEKTYRAWRQSIQTKNDMTWRKVTAKHRQIAVKNRLLSEKKKFPAGVFDLPALPPSIDGLKHLASKRQGATAKSYYYGKINFGLGANPTNNLLALSFVGSTGSWLYDQAEYINLAALPEARKQLTAGDITYITSNPELLPSGQVPPTPVEAPMAQYIAKVYVYCPGREVRVQINQTSQHTFSNAQEAQLIIGGARHGKNLIQYTVKNEVPEAAKEPMAIRIYLMSETPGVKPIKAFEYQIKGGVKAQGFGKGQFMIDDKVRGTLLGR